MGFYFNTGRNMKTFVAVFAIIALIAYAEGVPGADCYRKGREFPSWKDESEINISYRNKDGTSASFSCTCVGSSCQKLDCKNLNAPEEEEEEEEEEVEETPVITITTGGDEEEEEEYEYEEEGEEEEEGCYSDVLKKYVTRGATVIHPGSPSKGCKCPEKGNSLVCVDLGCGRTMLPTPNVPYPKNMDLRNCFDPWLNREVADGSSYERVRQMTAYQSVTGTYSCGCNLGVIRCRAIDIPCCDSVSKEFKDYGEAVHVDYRGSAMACTCHRGQSAFRNCRFISAVTPTKSSSSQTPRRTTTPSRRRQQCLDSVTGRRSYVGDTYYRYVNRVSSKCTCTSTKTGTRVLCVKRPTQSRPVKAYDSGK